MTLRGVMPKTMVDGFVVELIKHREHIPLPDTIPLIDYCYEICITCDGTNPYYSSKSQATFLVTQRGAEDAGAGIIAGDAYLPIIILSRDEELSSIMLEELKQRNLPCAVVTFTIGQVRSTQHRTLTWMIRMSEAHVMH
jgi:hypothetical protein